MFSSPHNIYGCTLQMSIISMRMDALAAWAEFPVYFRSFFGFISYWTPQCGGHGQARGHTEKNIHMLLSVDVKITLHSHLPLHFSAVKSGSCCTHCKHFVNIAVTEIRRESQRKNAAINIWTAVFIERDIAQSKWQNNVARQSWKKIWEIYEQQKSPSRKKEDINTLKRYAYARRHNGKLHWINTTIWARKYEVLLSSSTFLQCTSTEIHRQR